MSVDRAYERLAGNFDGLVRRGEPMARHTSFRIGGPAAIYIECDSLGDLKLACETLRDEELEWTVLGKGTNVLAADAGYPGAVMVLGRDFKRHALTDEHLRCGAGVSLAAIVQGAFSRGMTGMEFAVGIPGTVGGALAMNAGSRDVWIGERVESVTVFEPDSGLANIRGSEIDWGYRRSNLVRRGVIVEASLRLELGDEWAIRQTMEAALRRRKRSQPLGLPNAGSIFVNPDGDSAGRLIETSELKGFRIGGAGFSEVHANFIVNHGGASALDVLALIRLAQETVRDVHGIELRPEIRFLGPVDIA